MNKALMYALCLKANVGNVVLLNSFTVSLFDIIEINGQFTNESI